MHVEKCHAPTESYTYCCKEGDVVEYNEKGRPSFGTKKLTLTAKQLYEMDESEAINLPPYQYLQYRKIKKEYQPPKEETDFEYPLFDWQEKAYDYLLGEQPRKIMFVVDKTGN